MRKRSFAPFHLPRVSRYRQCPMRLHPFVVATVVAGCSSSSATKPDGSTNMNATVRYSGLLAGPAGETGVIELELPVANASNGLSTAAVPGGIVQGTLVMNTALGTITLSGTVDASGEAIHFEGTARTAFGRFMCTGNLVDGSLRGKCVGADNISRDFDSRTLGADPILRYCGTFSGSDGAPIGAFNVLTSGTYAAAIYSTTGLAGVAPGTAADTDLSFMLPFGTATGRVSGRSVSGDWSFPLNMGTFRGSLDDCPTPTSGGLDAGTTADTGVSPADTGTEPVDAGVPPDSGTVPTDSGATPADTGTVPVDGGVTADAGMVSGPPCPARRTKIIPLAQNLANTVIAAADGYVFYQDGAFIMRAGRDGTGLTQFLTLTAPMIHMVAAEGFLCFSEGSLNTMNQSFIRCVSTAGPGMSAFVVTGAIAPIQLSISGGYVYWNSLLNGIWAARIVQGSPAQHLLEPAVDLPSGAAITQIAATSTAVYFSHPTMSSDDRVYAISNTRMSGDMDAPLVLSTSGPTVQFMSTDGHLVAWLRYIRGQPLNTFGRLEAYNIQTNVAGQVNDQPQNPGALVVANGRLYYTYQSGIVRMGPTDMQPTPLLSGFSWTSDNADISLAVDDSCVFWAALSGGPGILAGPR